MSFESNQTELQGRGEFLIEAAENSMRNGRLANRAAPYLDGTIVREVNGLLEEWTGTGEIAGILFGPEWSASGNKKVAYITRRAYVVRDKVRIPSGQESAVATAFDALGIEPQPNIVVSGDSEGSEGGGDFSGLTLVAGNYADVAAGYVPGTDGVGSIDGEMYEGLAFGQAYMFGTDILMVWTPGDELLPELWNTGKVLRFNDYEVSFDLLPITLAEVDNADGVQLYAEAIPTEGFEFVVGETYQIQIVQGDAPTGPFTVHTGADATWTGMRRGPYSSAIGYSSGVGLLAAHPVYNLAYRSGMDQLEISFVGDAVSALSGKAVRIGGADVVNISDGNTTGYSNQRVTYTWNTPPAGFQLADATDYTFELIDEV